MSSKNRTIDRRRHVMGRHSQSKRIIGYMTVWTGDLSSDLAEPVPPREPQRPAALGGEWAEPTPELLRAVLEGLQEL
ncbi:hypothetical protein OOZ19_00770 [Saccharopolyspora sp. NFXS83]|uniref:hypothetical protein n=1 Tax=Saccharopolyspora sp. NFXS83 TaxID=2993560 RepID=UPI00224A5C5F|nr:hypothetical protein [Saccharopolyspora sp. NFXS83]MCX2728763.1 hypothetical protein [Saccharopolyspora sp. NFXS83]